jgi:hypothetical protein
VTLIIINKLHAEPRFRQNRFKVPGGDPGGDAWDIDVASLTGTEQLRTKLSSGLSMQVIMSIGR